VSITKYKEYKIGNDKYAGFVGFSLLLVFSKAETSIMVLEFMENYRTMDL
jgi:hypothetical protein